MSEWEYSGWIIEDEPREKLRLLKLHMKEVSDRMSSPVSHTIDGEGYTYERLLQYLYSLKSEQKDLLNILGDGSVSIMPFVGTIIGGRM